MRAAVIDIGSTTMNLVIGEQAGEDIKILETLTNVIDIGRGSFYQGRISQLEINQIIGLLENYRRIINEYEVKDVKVIATTAVREAENANMFIDTILRKTGFVVEVFNVGDVVFYIDAYLSQKLKHAYPLHERNIIIAELGSGSLDISYMEKGFIQANLGIPAGTLRMKQFKLRVDGSQGEVLGALNDFVDSEFVHIRKIVPKVRINDVILIDEMFGRYLPNILPSKKREPNFFKFTARESRKLLDKVTQEKLEDLSFRYNIPPYIADAFDGHALVVSKLFQLTRNHYIYILETSLSEAMLGHMILGAEIAKRYNTANQLISTARFLCQKYNADLKHAKAVAGIAEQLFGFFKGTLGLQDSQGIYLILASYLYNIGQFLSNRAHHKHSEYMINSMQLFRLTSWEIKLIACIARYHRKATPQRNHPLYASLDPQDQILVQKLSALIRMAQALDSAQRQKIKKLEFEITANQEINLLVHTQENFSYEKTLFRDRKRLFEELSGSKINLIVRRAIP